MKFSRPAPKQLRRFQIAAEQFVGQDGRFSELDQHAINRIGHQGKRYGYVDNERFQQIIGARLGH